MATLFQPETRSETKILVSTEIKLDIEREVAEQVRRIQRYHYKMVNRIGTTETNLMNIRDALRIIADLTAESDISETLKQKVEHFKNIYL